MHRVDIRWVPFPPFPHTSRYSIPHDSWLQNILRGKITRTILLCIHETFFESSQWLRFSRESFPESERHFFTLESFRRAFVSRRKFRDDRKVAEKHKFSCFSGDLDKTSFKLDSKLQISMKTTNKTTNEHWGFKSVPESFSKEIKTEANKLFK